MTVSALDLKLFLVVIFSTQIFHFDLLLPHLFLIILLASRALLAPHARALGLLALRWRNLLSTRLIASSTSTPRLGFGGAALGRGGNCKSILAWGGSRRVGANILLLPTIETVLNSFGGAV